jgi:hypothetical protein
VTRPELLSHVRALGASVSVDKQNQLLVDAPKGAIGPEVRRDLAANRDLIVKVLRAEQLGQTSSSFEDLQAQIGRIESEVDRLTDDSRLRNAARNLLDDCRAIWREGKHDSALNLVRDFSRRIPAYIRDCSARRKLK